MAAPSHGLSPPVEVHRLNRDIRGAVVQLSAIPFIPLALLLVLQRFDPKVGSLRGILTVLAAWAVVTIFAVVRVRIARLEILPDGVRYVSLFRDTRLRFEEIAGFRREVGRYGGRSAEAVGILYDTNGRRRLRISAYFEHSNAVRDWMHAHFRDLDKQDVSEERATLRRVNLSAPGTVPLLRAVALVLNVAAFALALLSIAIAAVGWLGPLVKLVFTLVFLMPPSVLALRSRFGRLIALEQTVYKSRFVRMDAALFIPLLIGWLVAFAVPPVRSRDAWPLAAAATLLFFFAARHVDRSLFDNRFMEAIMLAIFFGYTYGLVCFANAALDRGPAQAQEVIVRSRSARRGVATVVVSPGSSSGETHSLMVPRSLHEKLRPNSSAFLVVKPGAVGIPWIVDVAPAP